MTEDRRAAHARELRIIAGRWRGRRLRFPQGEIRPTPDRVRETLFNWLQPTTAGARCLDLFAGSGALGLEALSRGAAQVVFVDRDRSVAQALRLLLQDWQAQDAQVVHAEAHQYLATMPLAFDVVFLDPPFAGDELTTAAAGLERGWVGAGGRIYVEHARRKPLPRLPATWQEIRTGHAGAVGYHLFERMALDGGGAAAL